MTCTGCRYGERPTIWPGSRPGFSNSTSKVMPTQRAMNAACWRSIASCSRCSRSSFTASGKLVHVGGGRAGPRRIFERVGAGEADLGDQPQRVVEIALGLAREADDEVRRERDVGPRAAYPLDDAQIVRAGVAAVHRFENAVGARLHRQMQMRHQRRQVAVRRDQARRPCRADGSWCSAAARCRESPRGAAAAGRASRRGRSRLRRDRR